MADLELNGLPAAPGLAVGPAWEHRLAPGAAVPVPDIVAAAGLAATELDRIADTMRAAGHPDEADILGAQALMALDPMLLDAATDAAAAEGATEPGRLAQLVETSAATSARMLAALTDPLLAARATDVRDVGARIARIITGQALILPTRPSIAVAQDLPPSVTAEIPRALLLGIALEGGSPVSHAAILARGFGIPAIVAVPGLLEAVGEAGRAKNDVEVALDGSAGVLIIDPSRARRTTLDRAEAARRERAAEVMKLRDLPGQTRDGRRVPLVANIGRPEDAERALSCGAEGVGLFRSEFLFLGRPDAPTEDEQAMAYATVLRAFGPDRPVVIRLADIGGDKEIPYLHLAHEANPFLGIRGLRLALDHRELLVTQLRAIARAGAVANVRPRVMAPMVTTVEDVAMLHALADEAQVSLGVQGTSSDAGFELGIMVEVPSSALCARELAGDVAFLSIGSNDLTQYVMAIDRTHARLAPFANALHPAVLRLIRMTVEGADEAGIPVAVCGELAGDVAGALVLVGLGVDELSMDAGSLDEVRAALRSVSVAELEALAATALAARTAAEVRAAADALLESR